MKSFRGKWLFITLIFLISMILSSFSPHHRESSFKGSRTYSGRAHNKNKSRYNKKYNYKSKTVKKDYVIKNGIAR